MLRIFSYSRIELLLSAAQALNRSKWSNSMPREGAILADNDPRMAATKELRSLTITLILGCLAPVEHERS